MVDKPKSTSDEPSANAQALMPAAYARQPLAKQATPKHTTVMHIAEWRQKGATMCADI